MVKQKELFRRQFTINFTNNVIDKHESVVDIGSGHGFIIKELKCRYKVAVDSDLRALKDLKQDYSTECVRADASFLPFRENSFDITLMAEVLEHVKEPDRVIAEIYRISKKLIISTPNNCYVRRLMWWIRRKKLSHHFHVKEYSWKEVIDMVETVGFRLKKFTGIEFVINKPYFLTCKIGMVVPKLSGKMFMVFRRDNVESV